MNIEFAITQIVPCQDMLHHIQHSRNTKFENILVCSSESSYDDDRILSYAPHRSFSIVMIDPASIYKEDALLHLKLLLQSRTKLFVELD